VWGLDITIAASRSKGKPKIIMAIFKCTHADDRLLQVPPPEKIEEMREIVVALGFERDIG